MANSDVPYENTLSIEDLRREVRECWNQEAALMDAVRMLPEVPSKPLLWLLATPAMNHHGGINLWDLGKALQRKHGLDAVPPKTELECAAGLWSVIRDALTAARTAT